MRIGFTLPQVGPVAHHVTDAARYARPRRWPTSGTWPNRPAVIRTNWG